MYKIYADNELIYDGTTEDYKIGKGLITLEINKSGSFVFSLYPDHYFYDKFVRLKTVIKVTKSDNIVFRGRILNDVSDYWNNKVITCEGEMGFLQDSIIRPFNFNGTPEELLAKLVNEHNGQVDEFKRFKIGRVTVTDPNNYIARSNIAYESGISNINSRLLDTLGGYLYITHEDNEDIPTLNYLADLTTLSKQSIEFGSNLKNYTKTVKGADIGTAVIPIGATIGDGDDAKPLTIEDVNDGLDYVYSKDAVELYGWIFKTKIWEDVTVAANLKNKAIDYLGELIDQTITIELTAVDLHLLDPTIESIRVGELVKVTSAPHNFDSTMICNKQTMDLLKPDNDTLLLGYTYSSFTEITNRVNSSVNKIPAIQYAVNNLQSSVTNNSTAIEEVRQKQVTQGTEIINDCYEIILTATESYVETSDYESYKETVASQLQILSDSISMRFESTEERIDNIDGDLQYEFNRLYKHIEFSGENGIVIKEGDNVLSLTLDSGMIIFARNGVPGGRWDGTNFYTGNIIIDVTERAQFGNFAFVPRSDGSLSLLKVGG